jgi:nucleoid DNA-binding protein
MAKAAAGSRPKAPSKSEILNNIAESTGLSRKQVQSVMEALSNEINKSIGKKGPGVFQIPGVAKIYIHTRKAQPAKKNVANPFKPGEFRDIPAKPAKKMVKIKALKQLKDLVA